MSTPAPHLEPDPVVYPDSDGQPMADASEQFEFIQTVSGNLDALRPDLVGGDHLWYPVQGQPKTRVAPDVYVAVGRPKGHRGSYKQWVEAGVPLTVVFEWWSPDSTFADQLAKYKFYDRYGVTEFYGWDQVRHTFHAFVRADGELRPVDTSEGFTSPTLGIRFEIVDESLRIFRPDGVLFRPFRDIVAERDAAAAERDAALARTRMLEEKLRALGIEPS